MKKFTIGIAVLAVAGLVGYMGTTMVLNRGLLGQATPVPNMFQVLGPEPTKDAPNSKPDNCATAQARYNAADRAYRNAKPGKAKVEALKKLNEVGRELAACRKAAAKK